MNTFFIKLIFSLLVWETFTNNLIAEIIPDLNKCASKFKIIADNKQLPSKSYAEKFSLDKHEEIAKKMQYVYGDIPENDLDLMSQLVSLRVNNPNYSKTELAKGIFNKNAKDNLRAALKFIQQAEDTSKFSNLNELQLKNLVKIKLNIEKLLNKKEVNYLEETMAILDYTFITGKLEDSGTLLSETLPRVDFKFLPWFRHVNKTSKAVAFEDIFTGFPYHLVLPRIASTNKVTGEVIHLGFRAFNSTFGTGVNYYELTGLFDVVKADGVVWSGSRFIVHDLGHAKVEVNATNLVYFNLPVEKLSLEAQLNQSYKWKKIGIKIENMIQSLSKEDQSLTRLVWFYLTHENTFSPTYILKEYSEGTSFFGNKFVSFLSDKIMNRMKEGDLADGLKDKNPSSSRLKKSILNIINELESTPKNEFPEVIDKYAWKLTNENG